MKKILFVLAAVIISTQLFAQDSLKTRTRRAETNDDNTLEGVVVTTNKFPQKQTATGKVITVIDRQELERNAGKTLSEMLNNYPGMTMIGGNNVAGTNITSSIRGSSAGNVLILLDGIPVNDPSVISNNYDLNFISTDQIERIEILKGGQSTLYGSDAVAGVINIISKKNGTKGLGLSGTFTGGSYHTLRQSLGINGKAKTIDYTFGYTHLNSAGFSAATDTGKADNFDRDGYNQHALNARFGFKAGKRIHIDLQSTYSRYKTDLDAAAFKDDKDYTVKNINKEAGGGVTYNYNKLMIRANYSFNRSERDYLNDSLDKPDPGSVFSKSEYVGRTHFAELYGKFGAEHWSLLIGGDYRANNTEQHYISTGIYGPYTPDPLIGKMNQVSPYASVSYNQDKGFNVEAGGRVNIHSEYGTNATFNFNPFYLMENRNKVFVNLYSSFKAPTLYQLFDGFAGNQNLKPETGITGEAGFEMRSIPAVTSRIVAFYRKAKNNIVFTSDPNPPYISQYLNASKQTNYGAELEFAYAKEKKEFSLNYTYTDGKTTAGFDGTGAPLDKDTTYYNLYRIPKHALNIMLGYHPCKNAFTSIRVHTIGKRDEFVYAGKPEVLKGYTTIDLYGEYRFGSFARLFLDLKNITNKQYFDFLGYNARRFNFTTGVSFQL